MTNEMQQARQHAEALGLVQPQAIITLKVAEERDRTMWVAEDVQHVLDLMAYARNRDNEGHNPMVRLTRVMGMKPSDYFTRHDNIANVEAYR